MSSQPATPSSFDRIADASGLGLLAGLLRQALKPERLLVAFLGVVATLVLTSTLDTVWAWAGAGVSTDALERHLAGAAPVAAADPPPATGPWEAFWRVERGAITGTLASAVPGLSAWKEGAAGEFLQSCRDGRTAVEHFSRAIRGVWWLLTAHPVYFLLLAVGLLGIWSAAGGVVSRVGALEMTRGEPAVLPPAVRFTRKHFAGLFFAPCFPLVLAAVAAILLAAYGLLMKLPILGDIVGGALFFLALLGGVAITVLLIGACAGGPLMIPAVTVDGEDAFNAFSRAVSYAFRKPWKTAWYGVVVLMYTAVCWLAAALVVWAGAAVTRGLVSWGGATPLGLAARGPEEKLSAAWPLHGPLELFTWPTSTNLGGADYIAAFLIGLAALAATGLLWALLASLYLHAATAMYLLLRRDADGTDLQEVFLEET